MTIILKKKQYIKPKIKDNEESNHYDDETNDTQKGHNEKCRICLDTQSTEENPKLRLCSCKDCIHYECLKKYIKTKIQIQGNLQGTVKTYICKNFNCDICFDPYPLRFKLLEYNRIYTLIDYDISSEINHIVLESLDYIKGGTNLKIVHVVVLIDEKIYIGRNSKNDILNNENDIVDLDISVSRKHAVLKFNKENGNLTIENRSEKFGTLVLIKGNVKVKEKKIFFQVGNNFISARIVEENEFKCNDTNNNK